MATVLYQDFLATAISPNLQTAAQKPSNSFVQQQSSSNWSSTPKKNEHVDPEQGKKAPTKPAYDSNTVHFLFSMMKNAGYGNCKQQRTSLKDVFKGAVNLAEQSHGIKRTAKGWQKKFTRIKQEYFAFIAMVKQSGRYADDDDLFNTSKYFENMHELEKSKARHDTPGDYSIDEGASVAETPGTSTRKRTRISRDALPAAFLEKQEPTNEILIAELRKGNQDREKTSNLLDRLVEKF